MTVPGIDKDVRRQDEEDLDAKSNEGWDADRGDTQGSDTQSKKLLMKGDWTQRGLRAMASAKSLQSLSMMEKANQDLTVL